MKVSDCKVTLGFVVSVMLERLQKSDIWRRRGTRLRSSEGNRSAAALKKKKKEGERERGGPESRGLVSPPPDCQGSVH